MKLNRLPSSHSNRAQRLDQWLRDPFCGFSAVSQLLESLPELHVPCVPDRIPADVFEVADAYHLQFEVPGVKKEDLTVELQDSQLRLTAVKKYAATPSEATTTLTRTIAVPKGVEHDSISAKLEYGILHLTLPKSSEGKTKTIAIL